MENWQFRICYHSPIVRLSFTIVRLSFAYRLLSFAIVRLSFAIVHLSFAIVHLSFAYFAIVHQIPRFCSPAVRYSSRFSYLLPFVFPPRPKNLDFLKNTQKPTDRTAIATQPNETWFAHTFSDQPLRQFVVSFLPPAPESPPSAKFPVNWQKIAVPVRLLFLIFVSRT